MTLRTSININSIVTAFVSLLLMVIAFFVKDWISTVNAEMSIAKNTHSEMKAKVSNIEALSNQRFEETVRWMKQVADAQDRIEKKIDRFIEK